MVLHLSLPTQPLLGLVQRETFFWPTAPLQSHRLSLSVNWLYAGFITRPVDPLPHYGNCTSSATLRLTLNVDHHIRHPSVGSVDLISPIPACLCHSLDLPSTVGCGASSNNRWNETFSTQREIKKHKETC